MDYGTVIFCLLGLGTVFLAYITLMEAKNEKLTQETKEIEFKKAA